MRASLLPTVALIAAFGHAASPVSAEETRELDSHEHGHVVLQIAIEGEAMTVELEAPGQSIVGFEHEAETDEQRAAVEAAKAQLADAEAIFVLPDEAGCTQTSAEVELHREGEHNAFEASYGFTCSNAGALASVETKLFSLYPAIEEIEVEYATGGGQGAVELEPGNGVVVLPPAS